MLQLEYICTEAEMREAKSLGIRQQLGKGSRVRTYVVLFGILTALLALLYFRIRTEIPSRYQPWFLALCAVLFVFFFVKQRLARKRPQKHTKVEVSDRDVTIAHESLRVSTPWSGFSQCLESPNLFVLVDKTKRTLLVFPKRVFPDESAQNWFRGQATQHPNAAASTADMPVMHTLPATAKGITLNYQLGYKDYLNRTLISWRTKGLLLLVYIFITGLYIQSLIHPYPGAVNSPTKVYFVYTLPVFTPMLAIMLLVVAFIVWRNDKKYLIPHQYALSAERIDFASADGNGFIPWTTYKYWLENRWCFVVWNPQGPQWNMFPKRAFTSPSEIESCRALLQQNLKRSRWFFI